MRRHTYSPIRYTMPTTFLQLLASLLFLSSKLDTVSAQSDDYYCGLDWLHAAETCPKSCPTGNDIECTSTLGSDHGCFFFTGCAERVANGEFGTPQPTPAPTASGGGTNGELTVEPTPAPTTSTPDTSYCGTSWIQSMLTCDDTSSATPCPNGPTNCNNTPGQTCYSGIVCTSPLTTLKSASVLYSAKDIPIFYTLKDSLITRYKIYVWLKLTNKEMTKNKMSFDDFTKTLPKSLLDKAFELGETYNYINITEFWNDNTI